MLRRAEVNETPS